MDHIITQLQNWLEVMKQSEPDNLKAIECIENAIKELQEYYPKTKDQYGNPIK